MSISNSRTLYTDYIQLQIKYEDRHQTKNQNILKCHGVKCTYYNFKENQICTGTMVTALFFLKEHKLNAGLFHELKHVFSTCTEERC